MHHWNRHSIESRFFAHFDCLPLTSCDPARILFWFHNPESSWADDVNRLWEVIGSCKTRCPCLVTGLVPAVPPFFPSFDGKKQYIYDYLYKKMYIYILYIICVYIPVLRNSIISRYEAYIALEKMMIVYNNHDDSVIWMIVIIVMLKIMIVIANNDDTGNNTDDGDDVMILRNMKFMLMIAMMMLQQW